MQLTFKFKRHVILDNSTQIFTGARDYKLPVNKNDIDALGNFCKSPTITGCEEPLQRRLFQFLETTGQAQPETVDQAKNLLRSLIARFHF
jgi:hypothetical protein